MTWRPLLLLALVVVGATAGQSKEPTNACQGCRSIVSLARSLNSTTLRDQYADLLKNFCEQYYPPSTDFQQGPCPTFVQGLFYVMNNTDPVAHCDEIGVCGPKQPSDDIYDYIQSSNALAEKQPLKGDGLICDFCVNMLDQFRATLTDPEAIKKIYAQAQAFCSYLKVIDKEQDCQELINKYLEYAVTIIKQINSREYCASINMCQPKQRLISNSDSEQGRRQLPTLADFSNFGIETAVSIGPKPIADLTAARTHHQKGPECALCKEVVKEMFRFLRNNKTEANIVKGLDRVCNLLYPSEPNLGQCKSMVKAYTREIVQLLVDETSPEVICMLLEQCAYVKDLAPQQQQQQQPLSEPAQILTTKPEAPKPDYNLAQLITALDPSVGVNSMRSCFECKVFISYLRDKLGNPKSQAELKQWLLDNLCKELPEKGLVDSCSSMVEAYSDVFFKAIAGDLNPRIACVDLGACNASSTVQVFNLANGNEQTRTSLLLDQTARLSGAGTRRQTKSTQGRRCTNCTNVVAFLDDYLAAHPLSADTASLSKVCDNAHSRSIKGECVSIMKRYGADIVQSIPTMESPRHLCKQIALC